VLEAVRLAGAVPRGHLDREEQVRVDVEEQRILVENNAVVPQLKPKLVLNAQREGIANGCARPHRNIARPRRPSAAQLWYTKSKRLLVTGTHPNFTRSSATLSNVVWQSNSNTHDRSLSAWTHESEVVRDRRHRGDMRSQREMQTLSWAPSIPKYEHSSNSASSSVMQI
jgi:hypothetical protein